MLDMMWKLPNNSLFLYGMVRAGISCILSLYNPVCEWSLNVPVICMRNKQ
jgi:hypothetical protein